MELIREAWRGKCEEGQRLGASEYSVLYNMPRVVAAAAAVVIVVAYANT